MYRLWMRGGIVVVAAMAVALVTVHGWAAKPSSGGGPPPAAGKIYFYYGNQPYSMNGSGGNKTPLTAENAPGLDPSSLRYSGGRRWSLFVAQTGTYDRVVDADGNVLNTDVPHFDLFASRPDGSGGTQVLQVTDLFGFARIQPNSSSNAFVEWSNDGQDSFVSCRVLDLSEAYRYDEEDDATELVSGVAQAGIVRVGVSGADLDAAANSGTWTPVGPLDEWEIVVRSPNVFSDDFTHTWSPDGTMVAYVLNDDEVYVTDIQTQATLKLFGPTNYVWTSAPQWQPGGDQIAFRNGTTLWVADAFGGGVQPVLETDSAVWSPDGNHFVFRSTVRKGTRYEYQLQRYDIATGSRYTLTSDLDKSVTKGINDWLID